VSAATLAAGEYGSVIGFPAPTDRNLKDLISTAIVVQSVDCEDVAEAIPQVDTAGYYTPLSADVLPAGYGVCASEESAAVEAWRSRAEQIVGSPRLALGLGTSAFSPFIAPLNRQSRLLNFTGEARQGKSSGLRLCASVWGDPGTPGRKGIVQSWNASSLGIPQYLGRLGVMGAFLDEAGASTLDTLKRMALVYSMVEGNSRLIGTTDGLGRTTAGWAGAVFSSSNASMLTAGISAGAGAGIPARLLELHTPFTRNDADADALQSLARTAHGHVGRLILARYSLTDVENLISWAAGRLPIPADATVTRTIYQHWHDAIAGAVMLDTVLGTGTTFQDAALFAAGEIDVAEPSHDAELMIDHVRDRIASTPAEWPTQAQYAEWHRARPDSLIGGGAEPGRAPLSQHGIAQTAAGILADDGTWVAVLPGAWREMTDALGVDSGVVCEWMDRKKMIDVAASARRRNEWQTVIKADGKSVRAYKLVMPAEPDDTLTESPDGDLTAWLSDFRGRIDTAESAEAIDALPWDALVDGTRDGRLTEADTLALAEAADRRRAALVGPAAPVPGPRAEPPVPSVAPIAGPRRSGLSAPAGAASVTSMPAPRSGGKTTRGRAASASSAPAAPAVVYVDAGTVHTPGGTFPAPGSLAELAGSVAAGVSGEVLVLLTDPGAYGLTGKAPSVTTRWHRGFKVLTDAGWHAESVPSKRPTVGPWTNMQHPEYGTVRLCVLPWLTQGNPFPLSKEEVRAGASVDGAELVRRVELLARVTGVSYRGTQANTSVTLLRELLSRTARTIPRWQGTAPIMTSTAPLDVNWSAPNPAEAAAGQPLVYEFDGRRNYLQPIREVRLCLDDLSHTGPLRYDPKLSGLFKIEIPAWPWSGLPAPTSQTGIGWVTAPVLKAYVQLGMVPRILESYSGPGRQTEGTREFVRVVSEAYTATGAESDRAVREAVKGLYQTLHGKLEAASTRIGRPDWGLAIRDEAWCSVLRRVYTNAGIKDCSDVPTGPLPLRINTDEISYASAAETPEQAAKALPGIRLGDQLGEYGCKRGAGIPFDQWTTQGSE